MTFLRLYFCPIFLFQFLLVFGLQFSTPKTTLLDELYYPQPLDHFGYGNMSKIMFNQRYFIDKTYWAGPKTKSPVFVYFGGESTVGSAVQQLAVVNEAAPRFKALVIYIEHRFYGLSIPFGDIDIAMKDVEVRGCFTSEQAMMDFAELILTIKKNILGRNAPIVAIGCSYSGMLAAWFRLKFPHIVIGALASSAPVYFFDASQPWENRYCDVVSGDFKDVNRKCYERIKQSWDIIDRIALQPHGLEELSKIFKTCRPLLSADDLKWSLSGKYTNASQYNGRYNGMINGVCDKIVAAPDNDILGGVARSSYEPPCYNPDTWIIAGFHSTNKSYSVQQWDWQTCTELVVRTSCGNNTMFQPYTFNMSNYVDYCMTTFNISPRQKWLSTYYGDYDTRSALKRSGSNIIFSNGLMDPYSSFGVLEDISESLVAITTKKGSHCLDLVTEQRDDPKCLRNQRKKEIKILARWIQSSRYSNSNRVSQTWVVWLALSLTCVFLLL